MSSGKRDCKIKPVELPDNLRACSDLMEELYLCGRDEEDVHNVCFEKQTQQQQDCSDTVFENVLFMGCSFDRCDFSHCTFRNVRFEKCSFLTCDFSSCWVQQCEAVGAQFKGSSFTEARLMGFTARNSSFRYANFTTAVLDQCLFADSDLSDSFFAQCRIKALSLERAQFMRTEFFQTPLGGIDFTSCLLEGIRVSEQASELRGVIVNTVQAAGLAQLLGIVVRDQ